MESHFPHLDSGMHRTQPEMNCVLCNEAMGDDQSVSIACQMHRQCALRSSMGGIGHLIAHEYWCLQKHDPDAGLTFRQSAVLVDEFVAVVGVEETVSRL